MCYIKATAIVCMVYIIHYTKWILIYLFINTIWSDCFRSEAIQIARQKPGKKLNMTQTKQQIYIKSNSLIKESNLSIWRWLSEAAAFVRLMWIMSTSDCKMFHSILWNQLFFLQFFNAMHEILTMIENFHFATIIWLMLLANKIWWISENSSLI